MKQDKKAIILLSGGVDSKTCFAYAKQQGYDCYALTFDYGQRNRIEIEYAKKIAVSLGAIEHRVIQVDLASWGGSAMTDLDETVPCDRHAKGVPSTYVPARNTVFLSIALSYAEAIQASDVFIGVNAMDYAHYPDCRPEYIKAFIALAKLATRDGIEGQSLDIQTPLLRLSKPGIIRMGRALGIDYDDTLSCYNPGVDGEPCLQCEACQLRAIGFELDDE